MTTGFLAHFEALPDLSRTVIRVAEDRYDPGQLCIGFYHVDFPSTYVFKREDTGDAKGLFYLKRLRALADCDELDTWLGANRAKFPVAGGWGIVGEGHDCRTDVFGALLLQIFPGVTLYLLDCMDQFEDMTADCRALLRTIENQTESRDTNIFINPNAIILEKVLAKRTRITLASRDLTTEGDSSGKR